MTNKMQNEMILRYKHIRNIFISFLFGFFFTNDKFWHRFLNVKNVLPQLLVRKTTLKLVNLLVILKVE